MVIPINQARDITFEGSDRISLGDYRSNFVDGVTQISVILSKDKMHAFYKG